MLLVITSASNTNFWYSRLEKNNTVGGRGGPRLPSSQ